METVEKNIKYKLVYYNGKHYIINLNRNKLSYVFPMLNYLTRQPLEELNEQELKDIKNTNISKEVEENRSALIWISTGIGTFISIMARPIVDSFDFSNNILLNLLLVSIVVIPMILIKYKSDKVYKKKIGKLKQNPNQKAFILPKLSILIKNILINVIFTLSFLLLLYEFLFPKESNYLYIFGIIVFFFIILFQNSILYGQTKIEGTMGKIKGK
ncbi:DUF443 family protein [Staphylococcus caprae]|uniref:DUF443 family protein n=2 Tax=Staphylococcus caprae TaxID=29380 RepID=UPI00254A1CD9|nr:DUF443 family protein [Staphylococcus caprae]MDK6297360.1 DUF443 family protein [Staphylococcus caprae]MDK7233764.1 DUF443 family protein [Staphylococcus caprae]